MQNPTMKKAPAPDRTMAEATPEEEIRRRAYELYEEGGRKDGYDIEDWLRAEAEIVGRTDKAAAA